MSMGASKIHAARELPENGMEEVYFDF